MTTEEWRSVEGWPYEVSNEGRVRRASSARGGFFGVGRIVAQVTSPTGYRTVSLWVDGKMRRARVHQLVAAAFVGPRPGPAWGVNHKDGDKTNNRPANLEWVTSQENTRHAMRHGLRAIGARQAASRLNDSAVVVMRFYARRGVAVERLAQLHRVTYQAAASAIRGRTWSHVRGALTPGEWAGATKSHVTRGVW